MLTSQNRRLLIATLTSCALLTPTTAYADSSETGSGPKGEAVEYLTATDSKGVTRTVSTKPLDQRQLKRIASNGKLSLKRQLPSAKWRACAWNAKENKVVHDYTRIRVRHGGHIKGSTAYLECGSKKFGYKHILGGHQKDWADESWYINQNWRDLAGWSIYHILRDPDKVVFRKDKSWCWSRAIFLYKGKKHVKTIYPKVGLGATGKRIITAFPSGTQCSGKKVYPTR